MEWKPKVEGRDHNVILYKHNAAMFISVALIGLVSDIQVTRFLSYIVIIGVHSANQPTTSTVQYCKEETRHKSTILYHNIIFCTKHG